MSSLGLLHPLIYDGPAQFLDEMREKLHPVGLEECQTLLGLKKKEHLEKGYPLDENLYIWDYGYYKQKLMLSLGLDKNLVKKYFPVSVIVPKIIKIYQELLSIEFVEMKGKGESWHKGDPSAVGFTC